MTSKITNRLHFAGNGPRYRMKDHFDEWVLKLPTTTVLNIEVFASDGSLEYKRAIYRGELSSYAKRTYLRGAAIKVSEKIGLQVDGGGNENN